MKQLFCLLFMSFLVVGCQPQQKEEARPETNKRTNVSNQLVQQGFQALQQSQPVEAIKRFNAAVAADPQNLQAHVTLAQTLVQLKQLKQAEEVLERTTQVFPEEPLVYYMFAAVNQELEQPLRAIVAARRSYELYEAQGDPENAARSATLLNFLVQQAKDAQAEE